MSSHRHRKARHKQRGGMMTSMRGGFRAAVKGGGTSKPANPTRKFLWNLLTVALLVAAAVMLARRFGWIH
jgi:hypothetical protein